MKIHFRNRAEAGADLSQRLQLFANSPNAIVLALPRGGVPVAFEISRALNLPMDVMTVRKLGMPGYEELALGAIASGGTVVLNKKLIEELRIPESHIEQIAAREEKELEQRESLYRKQKSFPNLNGQVVILVDDGIATGATMRAAISAVKQQNPQFVIVATPVSPPTAAREIHREVDELICLTSPAEFRAVGEFYDDFSATSDAEVRMLLEKAERFGQKAAPEANVA